MFSVRISSPAVAQSRHARQSMEYVVRNADFPGDSDAIVGIWERAFPDAPDRRAKLAWFYESAIVGRPICKVVHRSDDPRPVGVAALGRRKFHLNGNSVVGGLLVDLAVDPAHRAVGPALQLERALYGDAAASCAFLYGFPNRKAAPIFRRAGYAHALDIVRYVRVLRPSEYIAERASPVLRGVLEPAINIGSRLQWAIRAMRRRKFIVSTSTMPHPETDEVWRAGLPSRAVAGARDATFLRWRFCAAGARSPFFMNVFGDDQRLCAWFACEKIGRNLTVRDFWSLDGERGVSNAALDILGSTAFYAGFRSMSVEIAGPPEFTASWRRSGFARRDERAVYVRTSDASSDLYKSLILTNADEDE